ncbi:DUF5990 family protein [Streptomyces sp. B1866]|uniref:DUF5990 family protein n=1 Tax=Streptomyces sp. B1866 TaxID=3075431 RepID=UPI002891BE05|nr:DUF5990 family protein [Streptomyces sp. B1866]MDT3400230.1 DUF5990 family protein [Streptomyces sp. B1866]
MSRVDRGSVVTIRIVGRDLPGPVCGDHRHVHVGVQRGAEPVQVVPSADGGRAVFEVPVEVVTAADGSADYRGPYVHGRRGGRFLYLTWGERPPGGPFAMFRRAKLALDDIPGEVWASAVDGGVVEGSLGLADADGMPVCASVRPPRVAWRAEAGPAAAGLAAEPGSG